MKFLYSLFILFICTLVYAQQQNIDVNKFTQLLSNHLLFEHFDKAYVQLARKISLQFRDAIHVRVKKVKKSQQETFETPVDIQILKRQLKGAVGSFLEDKLPIILTNRHNTTNLQNQLDYLLAQYCPIQTYEKRTIDYQCLLDNRDPFLKQVHQFTTNELQHTLLQVNQVDLPRLFEKTRAQISGILIHFNQHTMNENYHRLELKVKEAKKQSLQNTTTLPSNYLNNSLRNWITPDMIHEFIQTIHHTDIEAGNNIQRFLDLSL